MTADAYGNDITAVAVPVTGNLGIAPKGTTLVTPTEGGASDFTIPAAFKKAGLVKDDGGPQWSWEPDGDPIQFWQDGYSIPSGKANVTLEASFAQTDDFVRSIVYGAEADANHYIIVDGGGSALEYVLFTEEVFKNGVIRRRQAAVASVQSVKEDQSKRGEVLGYDVVFEIKRSPLLANGHFGEWVIPVATTP